MSAAASYLAGARAALDKVESSLPAIRRGAALLADAAATGRSIYSFGASHSFMMTEELVYRSGGLMLINPIAPHGMHLQVRPMTLTSQLERLENLGRLLLESSPAASGDVLILTSTSGRNTVIVDMALAAREKGLKVIGLTSGEYSSNVPSRHPSGKRLADLCDVVLENGAPYGDAAGAVKDFPQKVGPVSTVGGCAALNAMVAECVELLVARGVTPPVFMSANVPGGDEFNAKMLQENAGRIHYMN
jgi:uncharacterized phosphosugar-binding protein